MMRDRDNAPSDQGSGRSASDGDGFNVPFLRFVPVWLRWMSIPAVVAVAMALGAGADSDVGSMIQRVNEFPHGYDAADNGAAIGRRITAWIDWITDNFDTVFKAFDDALEAGIERINTLLLALPWPAVILLLTIIGWRLVGWGMGVFTALATGSIIALGMWDNTMLTVTLISISLSTALVIAIPLGIFAAEYRPLEPLTRWVMDTMQTLPSMVYLVPALAMFGLGNVAGVIATVVFIIPPAFKFVYLGIRGVPREAVEAAESFGASWFQVLMEVKIPLALPNIMGGVSQATMASLAIIIVASLVGAKGLGDIVERSLTWLDSGTATLAGFAIVIVAVVIDRFAEALAQRRYRKMGLDDSGVMIR